MAIIPDKKSKGFALLIAVIFMSVMLSFGLALGSLAYKQEVLASGAVESQYAFYVADAALECLLYADQQQNLFAYPATAPASAPQMTCNGQAPYATPTFTYTASQYVVTTRLSLDGGSHCADVTIYKPSVATSLSTLFSQGYDTSCANVVSGGNGARFVSRGLQAHY
jgi:Tfp pilus assembly protein PilX